MHCIGDEVPTYHMRCPEHTFRKQLLNGQLLVHFLMPNVEVQGRGAASSRSVPWNDGFGVLGGKLDDLERFTPLLGVPQVVLHLLAKPTLGAGVKGDG